MELIYFELNNWSHGIDYPDNEKFANWMSYECLAFNDENWVKKNKLCVVFSFVDMSLNFCVTAPKFWVEENCPELLTEFTQFLRKPEDKEYPTEVYGRFGCPFAEYKEENIGVTFWEEDEY